MGKVYLLDCTLRDGGYINDWEFGFAGIKAIIKKLEQTGIEMIEVGFLKGNRYNPAQTLFPDIASIKNVLTHKDSRITYVAMLDMSAPIPMEEITPNDNTSVDGIRVIFKKNKMDDAYKACEHIKRMGYKFFVNFVSTDAYTDKELIEGIEKFNSLQPDGVTIVDTFGMIKRKHFKRLLAIADNNLFEKSMLCYHAHNNLQQAYGNAEAMVEMNMSRDIVIDACVFGMGRGAGNLNLELFAEYMNDNYGKCYNISPMLEIMDEYLVDFYKTKFWGYSLPLYLSATHGCHPNYAIYLAEKNTLSEKSFDELLRSIKDDDKYVFNKDKAEEYYKKYMESFVDDSEVINDLIQQLQGKKILLLFPGKSLSSNRQKIKSYLTNDTVVITVNFEDEELLSDFIFAGNIRRYTKISKETKAKIIATSNIPDCSRADYVVNFLSLTNFNNNVFDNSALLALRLLEKVGVKDVYLAGMDGFSANVEDNYYKSGFDSYHVSTLTDNKLISEELRIIGKRVNMTFITPTNYLLK